MERKKINHIIYLNGDFRHYILGQKNSPFSSHDEEFVSDDKAKNCPSQW